MSKEISFEKAYARLDEILQEMNEGKVSLDDSLNLFEEANGLITKCNKKLNSAEQKIQTLIKNRNAELELENEEPKVKSFEHSSNKIMEE